MRSSNHFVIRNGKIISKTEAANLPKAEPQKLNVVQPTVVIVRHLQQKQSNQQRDDPLKQMQAYYEDRLKKYQQKIKSLESELSFKNQLIKQLYKQRQKYLEEQANTYQLKQVQSQIRQKQQKLDFEHPLSQVEIKPKCIEPLIQYKIIKIQQQNSQTQKRKDSQVQNQQSKISTNSTNLFQRTNSISSIPSMSSVYQQTYAYPQQKNQSSAKAFFDTSTLMARLNKSACLVRNIKKFLQPSAQNNNSPKVSDQNYVSSQNNKSGCEIQCLQQSEMDKSTNYQIQLNKFIDQLVQKNAQILQLTQQLSIQKDQEVRQVKRYYEDLIKKLQYDKSFGRHYSQANFNRNSVGKMLSKTCIQLKNKQNIKAQSKQFTKPSKQKALEIDAIAIQNGQIIKQKEDFSQVTNICLEQKTYEISNQLL